MLKLTQTSIANTGGRTVYIAANHVVAIYPDADGNGCHIELSTNTHDENSVIHVAEGAGFVCSQPELNR